MLLKVLALLKELFWTCHLYSYTVQQQAASINHWFIFFFSFPFLSLVCSLYSKPADLDAWVSTGGFFSPPVWILLIPSVMLLLHAYRLLLRSTDAGFYFLSLHFKRCSARKLHIISSIKIFTGSFCVAYSCWNRTRSGDVCCWLREQQKWEEMKVTALLLFEAMSLHLGSKKNPNKPKTQSPALNRMRERTKSRCFCRPCVWNSGCWWLHNGGDISPGASEDWVKTPLWLLVQ